MTPDQIALVQSSFAEVEPIAETATDIFYARLFARAPGYRGLFPQDMAEQKRKLMTMLGIGVRGLSDIDGLAPAVRALGARHVGYGVAADHYPVVGEALLWALRTGLGEAAFTPAHEEAWTAAYGLLAGAMLAGAEAQS